MTSASEGSADRSGGSSDRSSDGPAGGADQAPPAARSTGRTALAVVAWVWVSVPFLYGVGSLVVQVPALF